MKKTCLICKLIVPAMAYHGNNLGLSVGDILNYSGYLCHPNDITMVLLRQDTLNKLFTILTAPQISIYERTENHNISFLTTKQEIAISNIAHSVLTRIKKKLSAEEIRKQIIMGELVTQRLVNSDDGMPVENLWPCVAADSGEMVILPPRKEPTKEELNNAYFKEIKINRS